MGKKHIQMQKRVCALQPLELTEGMSRVPPSAKLISVLLGLRGNSSALEGVERGQVRHRASWPVDCIHFQLSGKITQKST